MKKEKYTKEYILQAIEDYRQSVLEAPTLEPPIFEAICVKHNWNKQTVLDYANELFIEGDPSLKEALENFKDLEVYIFKKYGTLDVYNAKITSIVLSTLGISGDSTITLKGGLKSIGGTTIQQEDLIRKMAIIETEIRMMAQLSGKPDILESPENIIHMHGGRGGSKTEWVARYVIYTALSSTKKINILCTREIQKSIRDSVYAILVRLIKKYNIGDYFRINNNEIINIMTESRIIFLGLKASTGDNTDTLKSIDEIALCWVEEAQTITQDSLEKLIPTIARVPNYRIIFTYNRHRTNTVIYDEFFTETGENKKPNTLRIEINYWENKFLNEEMIKLAEFDKLHNPAKWEYIWAGRPQKEFEGALWSYDDIKNMRLGLFFDRALYQRVVVATDPAMQNKDYNNEHGILVLGLTHDGLVHIIDDKSNHYTAHDYAKVTVDAYYEYGADTVVYESNQGGDFVANSIILYDPKVRVTAVRANKGKYERALPVANLSAQGKVMLLHEFPQLENQMLLITSKGYQGAQGESPDRLDAMVWGVYELLGMKDTSTVDTYFKMSYFKEPEVQYSVDSKFGFISIIEDETVLIIGETISEISVDKYGKSALIAGQNTRLYVKYIETIPTGDLSSVLNNILIKNSVSDLYIRDEERLDMDLIPLDNSIDITNISSTIKENIPLVDLASLVLVQLQQEYIRTDKSLRAIISREICQYNPASNSERRVLRALAELVCYEKGVKIV